MERIMKSWLAFRWVKPSLSVSLDRKARPLPEGANREFASCPLWGLTGRFFPGGVWATP